MHSIIVITGQTATGKTSYALKLAKEKNGELINADSRQIYKYLDIITGKDLPPGSYFTLNSSQNKFNVGYHKIDSTRLWLYDVVDPKLPFSSFDYKVCAEKVINDIVSRGKTPIIVGGTYLYIKHLLYGVETENIPPDWQLRKKLNEKSVDELQKILNELNNKVLGSMNNSDKNNPRRLIRNIEIVRHSGTKSEGRSDRISRDPIASLQDDNLSFTGFRYKNREDIEKNIRLRVLQRLEQGAITEVEDLLKRGYVKTDPGLQTIGYKEIAQLIEGEITESEMIERWILSEVQYAKRQYTFMKKNTNILWMTI